MSTVLRRGRHRPHAHPFGVDGGVLVSDVDAGSPAEQAGIRAGDVITTADGKAVRASRDLVAAIRNAGPDTTVELRVVRDKKDLAIRVMLPDGNASRPRRHIPI